MKLIINATEFSNSPSSFPPCSQGTLKLNKLKETKRGGGKEEIKKNTDGKMEEKVFLKANKGELAVFQKGTWQLRRIKHFRIHLHQA